MPAPGPFPASAPDHLDLAGFGTVIFHLWVPTGLLQLDQGSVGSPLGTVATLGPEG
jgi:hypothetical protein